MAKKKTEGNRDEAIVKVDADCEVVLPDWVRNDVRMLRWLQHRVVDMMASHNLTSLMIQDVEDRLASMCFEMVDDAVNDLIREAPAPGGEVARG